MSKSGAATLIHQSGSIFDIATAVCSRSNCAIGFVKQHRVLSLMEGLCRTANSCKAGMVVGALRIVCNGLCTAGRFHTAVENPGYLLGCHEGLDCIRHYNQCHTLFESLCALWPGTGEMHFPYCYLQRAAIQNCRSDWLCILVGGLLDAFVTAYDLQRTNRGTGLNFEELMYRRVKMMTPLCPAWAHTHQHDVLGVPPEQLSPQAFQFQAEGKQFSFLPSCRTTTGLTGIESPGWRLFTDGGIKRNIRLWPTLAILI